MKRRYKLYAMLLSALVAVIVICAKMDFQFSDTSEIAPLSAIFVAGALFGYFTIIAVAYPFTKRIINKF